MTQRAHRAWTTAETALLRETYATTPTADLAARFGRTPTAVMAWASRCRIRKHLPVSDSIPEIVREWTLDLETEGKAQNTCFNYARDLLTFARYLKAAGGNMDLEHATREDARAYVRSMTAERRLAATSRARRVMALRGFYDWLRRRDDLPASIAQDIRPPKRPGFIHRWLTSEQVAALRGAFIGNTPTVLRDRAMIELGLIGPRVSEVAHLELPRILNIENPEEAALVVHRKGDKEQYLPLPHDTREALRAWLAVRPAVPTVYVFFRIPFQSHRPHLQYRSIERIFTDYAARAGIALPPRGSFHLLRRSAGQRFADLGWGLAEAQVWLGHSSPNTTQIYFKVPHARLKEAARRFSY